jgi:hypothetical protein
MGVKSKIWGLDVEVFDDAETSGSNDTYFQVEGIAGKAFPTPSPATFIGEPPKLKPELKVEWLTALNHGSYKQGQAYLAQWPSNEKGVHYCCLGVLCEIERLDFQTINLNDGTVISMASSVKKYEFDETNSEVFLPAKFAESIGLTEEHQLLLSSLNDSGWTFEEIAALIERVC